VGSTLGVYPQLFEWENDDGPWGENRHPIFKQTHLDDVFFLIHMNMKVLNLHTCLSAIVGFTFM
jgi:hypothetical protein